MSLDVQDLDKDGDWDVVVGEHNLATPSAAALWVYENVDGFGGDSVAHLVYRGDEHHDGAQTVDIDGDGDLDILSIGWSHNRVLLYENRTAVCPMVTATPTIIPRGDAQFYAICNAHADAFCCGDNHLDGNRAANHGISNPYLNCGVWNTGHTHVLANRGK